MPLSAVVFDLDGTLVDSGADLAASANHVRRHWGLSELPDDLVIGFVGDGTRKLLHRTLAHEAASAPTATDLATAYDVFADHYSRHLLDRTMLYPGVAELLADLQPRPLLLATNKPRAFTLSILEGLGLAQTFLRVVAGDDLEQRKPHPEHLRRCLAGLDVAPDACAMVGDSPNDILPARELGMRTVALTWGLVPAARLAAVAPDHLVDDAVGLRRALLADG